jgi:hypothetical protein
MWVPRVGRAADAAVRTLDSASIKIPWRHRFYVPMPRSWSRTRYWKLFDMEVAHLHSVAELATGKWGQRSSGELLQRGQAGMKVAQEAMGELGARC